MEQLGIYNYWIYIALMMIGFYGVIAKPNLVKKIIGLSLFQTGIFLFYISMAWVDGGTAPIVSGESEQVFSNPLPHVLILTAIVVSVSTLAVAIGIIVNIKERYGTVESDEIQRLDDED